MMDQVQTRVSFPEHAQECSEAWDPCTEVVHCNIYSSRV